MQKPSSRCHSVSCNWWARRFPLAVAHPQAMVTQMPHISEQQTRQHPCKMPLGETNCGRHAMVCSNQTGVVAAGDDSTSLTPESSANGGLRSLGVVEVVYGCDHWRRRMRTGDTTTGDYVHSDPIWGTYGVLLEEKYPGEKRLDGKKRKETKEIRKGLGAGRWEEGR